ncbi:MAG: type VI secretion system tip protein VgrG [Rubrivivax sp.]|jgi:type VI secretion system secreted protein VgrG|nr:type VI secretion system tip protein VgrG [Rubrivivax sp.]
MANTPLLIELKTSPPGKLRFLSMMGAEELSRPFEYGVVALAKPDESVKFDDLLGKPLQVTAGVRQDNPRIYHGLITAVAFDRTVGSYLGFKLTMRPWLWLLTRGAKVRMFQQKSVPEILAAVFGEYGGTFDDQTQATYRKREFCVQFRETDFNFVSRLMEEEGIFYFFKHEEGKHTLVFGDSPSVHVTMLGLASVDYFDDSRASRHGVTVSRWRWSREIRTGKFAVRDYSFLAPTQTYNENESAQVAHAQGTIEHYEYPAGLGTHEAGGLGGLAGEAKAITKRRLEELRSRYAAAQAVTSAVNLCTGARLKLAKHPVPDQNAEYVVFSTRVNMHLSGYEGGASDATTHECEFSVFESKLPFRPERLTPRPRVAGPQTATVVGPSGEEIYVDKHGRVKLQFHWDREGAKDDKSSCFVRVAQPSAGKGWGMVFLPRIGQEVVVDFIEGDPDQPLVTGRVYNAINMPPYALPDKKTVSTIKSRSTKTGGAADFNEVRFDDLKGSEYLLMQAQKDKLEFVKETTKSQVGKDEHHIVKKDRKHKIEGEDHLTVVKDVKIKIDGKYNQKVAKDMLLGTDGLHSLKAAKDITAEAGTAYSIKAGTDIHVKGGKNVGVDGGMNVHVKGGMNVVIEAGMQLTLKAGSNSIVIGPDGVSITGMPMVKVNSGGGGGSGSGASPVAPTAPDAPTAPEAPVDPLSHG